MRRAAAAKSQFVCCQKFGNTVVRSVPLSGSLMSPIRRETILPSMLCVTKPSRTGVRWQRQFTPVMFELTSPVSRPSAAKRAFAFAMIASMPGSSVGSTTALSRCTS